MNFTVKQQHARFDVIGDSMILDSFYIEAEAIAEAARMNEEYERVLSFL